MTQKPHYTVTNEQKSAIDRCSDGFEEHNTTVSDLKSTNSRVTNEQKSAADRCSDGVEEHYTTIKDFKLTTSRNTTTEDHYAPADDRNFNTQLDIGNLGLIFLLRMFMLLLLLVIFK